MTTTTPPTLDQIRAVWLKWRGDRKRCARSAMNSINAILIADGEREQRLKTIAEDTRRDQKA
jgi:hypothetical protein